jgi:hypothetical protein
VQVEQIMWTHWPTDEDEAKYPGFRAAVEKFMTRHHTPQCGGVDGKCRWKFPQPPHPFTTRADDGKPGVDLESEMDGSQHITLCFFSVCSVTAIFRSQTAQRHLGTSSNTRQKVMPQFVNALRKLSVGHHRGEMRSPTFKRLEWLVRPKLCSPS